MKCLSANKQVCWLTASRHITTDFLKGTLHLLFPCVRWRFYSIRNTCQCFVCPCGWLPTSCPSSTGVRVIRSSRKRIYRESLAEVRLGFVFPPRASSKLCLLFKLKPDFWEECALQEKIHTWQSSESTKRLRFDENHWWFFLPLHYILIPVYTFQTIY